MGFTQYNYYLHGFLTILNTYASHILGIFSLPVFLKIINDGSKVTPKGTKEQRGFEVTEIYSLIILINVTVMTFSSIMVMATKRELMFP